VPEAGLPVATPATGRLQSRRVGVGLRWRAPAVPLHFAARDVWQHPQAFAEAVRESYGHLRLDTLGGTYSWTVRPANRAQFERAGLTTLGEYLDRFLGNDPRPLPYLAHVSMHRNLPDLKPYLVPPPEFGPNWVDHPRLDRFSGPEVYVGRKGCHFAGLHVDHCAVHVGFVQLTGRKRFTAFPPGDAPYLYTWRAVHFPWQRRNSAVRLFQPDWQERWPEARRAHPVVIDLGPGEGLVLPANWWHVTEVLEDGITWNVRIVNHTNVGRFVGEQLLGIPRAPLVAWQRLGDRLQGRRWQ
jgi:hypothetical protein